MFINKLHNSLIYNFQKNVFDLKTSAKLVVKKDKFLCFVLPIYIVSLSVLFNCL